MAKRFICKLAEVKDGGLKEVTLEGEKKICVINASGVFFACQAACPHEQFSLCDGILEGTTLTCIEHLWQWDLRSGEPMGLAEEPLPMFGVEVEGDSLYLKG